MLALCFVMAPVDTILSLSGKVRIGVARPIPVEDEEYEETPPETARYMGEQLLESNAQNGRGKLRLFKCPVPHKHFLSYNRILGFNVFTFT